MADNSTGLPVQTITGQFVQTKLVDSGGTNVAAVDASGRLSVNLTASAATVTVDSELPTAAALTDNFANPTAPGVGAFAMIWDGSTWDRAPGTSTAGLKVDLGADNDVTVTSGAVTVSGSVAHDAAGTAVNPLLMGGYASAAAPTNVSTDGDAVRSWYLLNGAQATVLTAAGALIGGDATNGLDVDVTRVIPGTTATALGKSQGLAYAANDVGVAALAVRNDAGTILTGSADQDYVNLTTDATGALRVTGGGAGTQYVGDAAATATPTGTMAMGLANSAAPSDVSANNDAVAAWYLRNGSQVVNIASDGTLVTLGQKVMASSLPVVIASDQAAFPVTVSGVATAANQTNVQIVDNNAFTDGTTTVMMGGYIFDESAGTALTENDAAAARVDSKRAQVIVGEDATTRGQRWAITAAGALASNITQVAGATQSATNPLFVRLTDGSAAYSASSTAPTAPQLGTFTSAALGAGANVDLETADIGGTTGQLMGVDVASTVPIKVIISTVTGGTPTTRVVLFSASYTGLQWRSPFKTFITRSSGAGNRFRVNVTNKDATVAADVYATFYYDQV